MMSSQLFSIKAEALCSFTKMRRADVLVEEHENSGGLDVARKAVQRRLHMSDVDIVPVPTNMLVRCPVQM